VLLLCLLAHKTLVLKFTLHFEHLLTQLLILIRQLSHRSTLRRTLLLYLALQRLQQLTMLTVHLLKLGLVRSQ
jgi:hypothetical protein